MNYIIEDNWTWPTVRVIEWTLTEQEKQDILFCHISEWIKAETENKILKKYPYYKQINLQNSVIEILASVKYENREMNESELEVINEAKLVKKFIDDARNECNLEILKLW